MEEDVDERNAEVLDVLLRLASGDFGARAPISGDGDTVDALAAGINMLAEEIEAHDERLQSAVRRQTEQLQDQNAQLEALDRQRSHLFRNASHELRTPLTLILGPLDDELAERPDNENLRLIDRNAHRLLRLVNQLLDFQKVSADRMQLENGPLELVGFLRVCADYFRSAAASHSITFELVVDDDGSGADGELWVWAEVDALEKVVFNYLSNALKFTPAGGVIQLAARRHADSVRVSVRDSGPGVSPKDQERLFEVFVQAEGSARLRHQGTGLGLALAKQLAQAMGGAVGVESELGKGATFWCDLQPSVPSATRVQGYDLRGGGLADVPAPPSLAERSIEPGTDHGLVLVVDDVDDVRALLARSISRAGYSVITASSGPEALAVLAAKSIDLVVTDWMMPEMTGPELITEIRADPATTGTPVVLLTARSDQESRLIGLGVGADAFLGKPFLDAELTSTVRNLVALKRREHEVTALNRYLSEQVLSRYLPQTLVDDILAGDAEALDRPPSTALVTVLFADLVGFTWLTEHLEAAEVTSLLDAFFTGMTEVAFAHGGVVDKFIGDGVMLLFGAPATVSPQEQVVAATRCAVAMHAKLRELADVTFLDSMRIGVHHGPAIVGNLGSSLRSDYTAIGATVNQASRIEGVCLPGATWVSASVAELLPDGWARSVGAHDLRGIGSVELFEVLD